MQKIGINGSFIRKPASGMGQVSWHSIQQLIKDVSHGEYSAEKFVIYLEEDLPDNFMRNKTQLPENIEFKIVKGWYKRDDLIRKILWEKCWLPKRLEKDGCDKFFSPYQSSTILSKGIKHTMFIHDVIPNIFPEYLNNFRKRAYYWLVGRAARRANKIITNSKFSRKEISLVYKIPRDKISVAYLACDPIFKKQLSVEEKAISLKKYGIEKDEKFILYEGGTDFRKNIGRIIEAYGELLSEAKSKNFEKIKLVIIGKFHKHLAPLVLDVEEKITEVAEKYKVNGEAREGALGHDLTKDMFRPVGFVEQEDLPAFFQSAEVFIYPSLYEGFGMPVLEAMTSGVSVVTSSVTSIPEVISKKAGYLIDDSTNVEEIKNKLQEALDDSEENRQAKITLAHQEAQKFSWEKFTNKVMEEIVRETV